MQANESRMNEESLKELADQILKQQIAVNQVNQIAQQISDDVKKIIMSYPQFLPLDSNDMKFICEWGQCGTRPSVYINFGCLEQHTGEVVLCKLHSDTWLKTMHTMLCNCGQPIDGFMDVLTRDIHPTWLDTLRRDQNARRAGKYLSGVGVPTSVNPTPPAPPLPPPGGSISPTVFTPRGNGKILKSMKELEEYYKYGKRNK